MIYTPNAIQPLFNPLPRRHFKDRVQYWQADQLRGLQFPTKTRMKKLLKFWKPKTSGNMTINIVEYENGWPTWKTSKLFIVPYEVDDLLLEMSNLADLHGIVRMTPDSIWVKLASDTNELNIDAYVMDKISTKLVGQKID